MNSSKNSTKLKSAFSNKKQMKKQKRKPWNVAFAGKQMRSLQIHFFLHVAVKAQ